MITVIFYNTSDDNLKVTKTLTQFASYNCEIKGECSIDNPRIEVDYVSGIQACNYAYIEDFHRYYYVKPVILDGHRIQFDCSVDRLMSFVSPNKGNITAYITRNENDYNPDIKDEQGVFLDEKDTTTRLVANNVTLPLSIDNWKFIGLFNAGLCNDVNGT